LAAGNDVNLPRSRQGDPVSMMPTRQTRSPGSARRVRPGSERTDGVPGSVGVGFRWDLRDGFYGQCRQPARSCQAHPALSSWPDP